MLYEMNSEIFEVGETKLNQYIKNDDTEKLQSGSSSYIPRDTDKDIQLIKAIEILSSLNKKIINIREMN